jgi:hypothetical protein
LFLAYLCRSEAAFGRAPLNPKLKENKDMAKMGKYCKAYPISRLRAYPRWSENTTNSRVETQVIEGKESEVRRDLGDDDYLYLQENFVVTDGIFIDQNIIFDNVTDDWKEFCKSALAFDENGHQGLQARGASPGEGGG